MKFTPYDYQRRAIRWVLDHPRCALFMEMGLGKSVVTLTALRLLMDEAEVWRPLVVAPKKVAESTWSAECGKWDHLRDLRVSLIAGRPDRKRRALADGNADLWVIGRDNFVWLLNECKGQLPFDTIVIDELTSFKSPSSSRTKAMKIASASASRVIGLTGTPAPNGLLDLWAQMYCIDLGERLGKSVTRYRDKYFSVYTVNHIPINITPLPGAEKEIRAKIADICLSMQAADYLTLPPEIVTDVRVSLPDAKARAYAKFEREKVLEYREEADKQGGAVVASSAAALMNKLAQFANGAVYDEDHAAHEIHSEKLEALSEIVESHGASSGILVFFQYRHDKERITAWLRDHNRVKAEVYDGPDTLERWNAHRIPVLLAHPASTAYGLNMQAGGHVIVWFGTGWDLELYQQANARLHRQGQTHPVTVFRLITAGTVDERAASALEGKSGRQKNLMDGLKELLKKYAKE